MLAHPAAGRDHLPKAALLADETSWTDPTHYHKFTLETLDVFVPETRYGGRYHWYTDRKWRYVKPPKLNPAGSSIVATLEVRK